MKCDKIIFIGLDGMPFGLFLALLNDGLMPFLRSFLETGIIKSIKSTVPPLSPVAWSSFMTGCNPGEHGIMGFVDYGDSFRENVYPSFDHLRAIPFWSKYPDKKIISMNLPFTYPARPANGIILSGFVAPLFKNIIFPKRYLSFLKDINYCVDVGGFIKKRSNFDILEILPVMLKELQNVAKFLLKDGYDILNFVITGTDRLHHYYLSEILSQDPKYWGVISSYYKQIDNILEQLFSKTPTSTRIVLISDHGFTETEIQVNVGNVLQEMGVLGPHGDDSKSKVIVLADGGIYIHSQSRFPKSGTRDCLLEGLDNEIRNTLASLKVRDVSCAKGPSSSQPIFENVFLKSEIYHGNAIKKLPDVVCQPQRGVNVFYKPNYYQRPIKKLPIHSFNDAILLIRDIPDNIEKITDISNITKLIPF